MPNRLANETSPYLLQHADNPVDWYLWGEEALAKAKAEDKPIFLSIGYSACHWCPIRYNSQELDTYHRMGYNPVQGRACPEPFDPSTGLRASFAQDKLRRRGGDVRAGRLRRRTDSSEGEVHNDRQENRSGGCGSRFYPQGPK